MPTCKVCNADLPEDAFYIRKDTGSRRRDCIPCHRGAAAARHFRDHQATLARKRAYAAANIDKVKASGAAYRQQNRGKAAAASRAWRLVNPERQKAANAAWRKANIDAVRNNARARAAANPEAIRHNNRLRKARLRSAVTDLTLHEWNDVVRAFDGRCCYCGVVPSEMTLDHVVPIIRGGHHVLGNVAPACGSCNSRKHDKTAEEFFAAISAPDDIVGRFREIVGFDHASEERPQSPSAIKRRYRAYSRTMTDLHERAKRDGVSFSEARRRRNAEIVAEVAAGATRYSVSRRTGISLVSVCRIAGEA